jgi:hypothetical protein
MKTRMRRQTAIKEPDFLPENLFARSWWRRIASKVQVVIETRAPLGYEDETGFHVVNEKTPVSSDAAMRMMPGGRCSF